MLVYSHYGISLQGKTGDGNTMARTVVSLYPEYFNFSTVPQPGSIISLNAGTYGHVGFVEAVSADGKTLTVSHGNINRKGSTAYMTSEIVYNDTWHINGNHVRTLNGAGTTNYTLVGYAVPTAAAKALMQGSSSTETEETADPE